MTTLMIPALDDVLYPTLGLQVADWIEDNLVFGPGDLRGEPARLDTEKRILLARMYEIYPKGHDMEGRRRFKRVAISLRKGSAKSEFAAWIAAAELHAEAPVRFVRWKRNGEPEGTGVKDPYIPLVAYTEEQSDELCYGALKCILEYSTLAKDFDIGIERIMRRGGDGKAVSLASAPSARDGARTSFSVADETHHWSLARLKLAHRTMLANLPKRKLADAWALEITTAPAPGEGSVAEDAMDYARQVADGKISDSRFFFFHRQAGDNHDLTMPAGIRAAVIEASGPVAEWSDIDSICAQWNDPTADRAFLERVWLNRLVRATARAFDVQQWNRLARTDYEVPKYDDIVLGFDGGKFHDGTGLVATHVTTGYQWVLGIWEEPYRVKNWEVPAHEVEAAVAGAFRQWNVWRMYADPPQWESYVAKWAGEYGEKRVLEWWTSRQRPMANAIQSWHNAIMSGTLSHDGNKALTRHVGNAVRRTLTITDDQANVLWTVYKERPDSPHKIDLAIAAILSWEARCDAVAAGVGQGSVYETRGILTI